MISRNADLGMQFRDVLRVLYRSIFLIAYFAFVILHCWMLRTSIAEQIKKGKLDAKYVIILLLLLGLSLLAFIPVGFLDLIPFL